MLLLLADAAAAGDTWLGIPAEALGPFAAFGGLALLVIAALWRECRAKDAEIARLNERQFSWAERAAPILEKVADALRDREADQRVRRRSP